MAGKVYENKKESKETYDRITAPAHVTFSHFKKHEKIEGYFEDRNVPDFIGCDRLLKLDTLYGTIQMGYSPRKGQPFLFANIKTSIYDTAASSYKKNLNEQSMYKNQKSGNENIMFSSRRRNDTATILYKAERKPWTEESLAPYIMRANQGALRKTMPFLLKSEEALELNKAREERKALSKRETKAINGKKEGDNLSEIRKAQVENLREQEFLESLLVRKDQQSRLFFKKINYAFDIQKHEMFQYYRDLKDKMKLGMEVPEEELPPKPDKNKDEEENES